MQVTGSNPMKASSRICDWEATAMLKPLARLCAVLMLFSAAGSSDGEESSTTFSLKEMTLPPIHPAKPNDKYMLNEHVHPLNGTYFPPESHHYQDFDMSPDAQLNRNVRILRTTSKVQLNRYVPIVIRLQHVNPYHVLRFFSSCRLFGGRGRLYLRE
jgi:hypothetical protein